MQPIRWGDLKNGLRYYSYFNRVANVSGIGVKHGSVHDPTGKCGMAHFVEHIVAATEDEETDLVLWKYLGDPDSDEWKVGTNHTSTFYGHNSLLWKPHMLACFEIFAKLVRKRALNQGITDSERAAVHQEYFLRGVDMMPELVVDFLHEATYEKNPARNRIDCKPEELEGITAHDINQFMKRHYVPGSMFVVFLGPSFEEVKKLAEKHFSDLPIHVTPRLDYDHSDDFPIRNAPKLVEIPRQGIHQEHVAMGFPVSPYTPKDKESETLDVLTFILGRRLYRLLRRKNGKFNKGVYRVPVRTSRSFVHGIFYIQFASSSREFIRTAKEQVLREVELLKTDRVSAVELDVAIRNHEFRYREAFRDTPGQLADMIIDAVSNGDEDLLCLHAYLSRLRKVNHRKILEVANKYFTPNYVQVSITPV